MEAIITDEQYNNAIANLRAVFRSGDKVPWYNQAHIIAKQILEYERRQREKRLQNYLRD